MTAPAGSGTKAAKTQEQLRKVAGLTQPFTPLDVQGAIGISKSGANGTVRRWFAAGWIKKVGYGSYERTSKYPGAPAAAPTREARPKASLADLKAQLADACKQRDHARSNGRDSIVEVFQNDIDRIEKEIEALA